MTITAYPPVDIITQPPSVGASVISTVTQLIGAGAVASVTFGAVAFDTDGMFSAASPNRLTIRTPGKYVITGRVRYDPNATGTERSLWIRKNGLARTYGLVTQFPAGYTGAVATTVLDLAAGDYIELITYNGGSVAMNIGNTASLPNDPSELSAALMSGNANGLPSGARVWRAAATSVPHASWTAVPFDGVDFDTDGLWNPTVPNRLTARQAGWYVVTGSMLFVANATGSYRLAGLRKNGTEFITESNDQRTAGTQPRMNVSFVLFLRAGEYIVAIAYQDSGGPLGVYVIGSITEAPQLSMVLISGTTVTTRQPPSTRLGRRGTPQTLVANTGGQVLFDTVIEDTDNAGDASTLDGIRVRVSGRYLVRLRVCFSANATGRRALNIMVNGNYASVVTMPPVSNVAVETTLETTADLMLTAGDVITGNFYHQGTGDITSAIAGAASGDVHPLLQATLIQPISVAALMAPEAWHEVGAAGEPAYANGWLRYDAAWSNAAFYKDPFGMVHLRGMVRAGSSGYNCFVLPVGYRPIIKELFVVITNNVVGRVDVYEDGGVRMELVQNVWVSLDGLNFRAA